MKTSFKEWTKSGEPWVWLNAGAVAICMIMVVGLLSLIAVRGLGHFWPADVRHMTFEQDGQTLELAGELVNTEEVPAAQLRDNGIVVPEGQESMTRYLLKVGNRDVTGSDFLWMLKDHITSEKQPEMLFAAERHEWGNLYGYLRSIKENGEVVASYDGFDKTDEYVAVWNEFLARLERVTELHDEIKDIEKDDIGAIN